MILANKFKKYISKPNLWLASIVKQNWQLGFICIGLGLFASILEGLSASLILPLTTYLSNNNSSQVQNIFPKPIEQIGNFFGVDNTFTIFIILFWGIIASKNSAKYYSDFNINKLKFYTGKIIREQITKKFFELDISFYDSAKTGELTVLINDHAERCQGISANFFILIGEFTTITCLLAVATYLSPQITLIGFMSFGGLVFGLKSILSKIKVKSHKAANETTKFSGLITEILDGIKVIKSYGLENNKIKEAQISLNDRCHSEIQVYKYASVVTPVTETLGISILLVILATFYILGGANDILPILLTYTIVMLRIIPRINYVNSLISQFSVMEGSLNLVYQFLRDKTHQRIKQGSVSFTGIKREIFIENLSFKYPNTEKIVIKNLSLNIKNGQKVALVGQSGSGKSTLVDMLMRYYDPTKGNIYIDDQDLKNVNLSEWRSCVAIVSQDTFLFNANIKDNIRYGRLNATNQEIEEAAESAYAMEFIDHLPEGLNTMVGQRGIMLSGGQKQRIALARAFLRNPQLLILDEATSALDTASELFVQKAIDKISVGRTVITIAHRLSTVKNADAIITMRAGEIIEQGTHEELLANKNQYWKLHNSHSLTTS